MSLQTRTSFSPLSLFAAADFDGLSLRDAIRKFVIGPDAQDLGMIVGATRTDGWVWLRAKNYESEDIAEDGLDSLEGPSGYFYPVHGDGIFFVHRDDVDKIMRDGIEDYRCERIAGLVLGDKRRDWLEFLFERDNWPDSDFLWSVDLSAEVLVHIIKSWAAFAEKPPSLETVKTVVKRIVERWRQLVGFIRRGELIAIGMNFPHRGRITLGKHLIDVRTGDCGSAINHDGALEVQWRDISLGVPVDFPGAGDPPTPVHVNAAPPVSGEVQAVGEPGPRGAPRRDPGGAPSKYHWDEVTQKLMLRIGERGMPETKKELIDWVVEFASHSNRAGKLVVPDESTAREFLNKKLPLVYEKAGKNQ